MAKPCGEVTACGPQVTEAINGVLSDARPKNLPKVHEGGTVILCCHFWPDTYRHSLYKAERGEAE